ncbi:MAG: EamA family transporter [Ignavibacteriales bacterium]|nr:EamA family transporter [Ignavibacteriales bacterium]
MGVGSPGRSAISIGLTVVCLIWGSTWLAIKMGLTSVPPLFAASLRFFISSAILLLLIVLQEEKFPRRKEFWLLSLVISFNNFSVPYSLIYLGQANVPTGLSSILFATYPFWVASFSHMRLSDERMTFAKGVGMVLGFAGIVVIFSNEVNLPGAHSFVGMGAILLAAALQAYALVILKKHGKPYSPVTLNFSAMSMGAVTLLVASIGAEDIASAKFETAAISSLLYLATFGTVVTFVTYFWLVKHVQAVLLSLTAFVTPIIAIIIGSYALQERLATEVLLGASMVLTGILFANAPGIKRLLLPARSAS